jgi:hypothetical protein
MMDTQQKYGPFEYMLPAGKLLSGRVKKQDCQKGESRQVEKN